MAMVCECLLERASAQLSAHVEREEKERKEKKREQIVQWDTISCTSDA